MLWGGNAVRDGGLLLDLSELKGIEIDPEARIAVVELAARQRAHLGSAAHGLYFPSGHCPTVGVAGFTLGGGSGSTRASSARRRSAPRDRRVTADGEELHATDEQHADLLRAARGSGPGFAAVTRLHLDVRPLPGIVATCPDAHARCVRRAPAVVRDGSLRCPRRSTWSRSRSTARYLSTTGRS
jgi:hypothetical protein